MELMIVQRKPRMRTKEIKYTAGEFTAKVSVNNISVLVSIFDKNGKLIDDIISSEMVSANHFLEKFAGEHNLEWSLENFKN